MSFGENLMKLRKSAGLSQEELANKLDLTRQAISKYESGISAPSIEKLILISEIFQVSLDELIKGQGEKNNINQSKTREWNAIFGYCFLIAIFLSGVVLYIINTNVSADYYNYTTNYLCQIMMAIPVIVFVVIAIKHKRKKK